MKNAKTNLNKTITFILIVAFLAVGVSYAIFAQVAVAEELTNADIWRYSSTEFGIEANNRTIGTIRVTSYVNIKPDGNALFIAQAEVHPKVNDGLNKYLVKQFSVDVEFGNSSPNLVMRSSTNNHETPIITRTISTSLGVCSDGTSSFNIVEQVSISADAGSISVNEVNHSTLPHSGFQKITYNITPNSAENNHGYTFASAHYFKFNSQQNDPFTYQVKLYNIEIEGIAFAPNYEIGNSDYVYIDGFGETKGEMYTQVYYNNMSDSNPNDRVSYISHSTLSHKDMI